MIYSRKFTCVIDTNIIYPIQIRDIIFWFAHMDLFTMKWSKHIFDEWDDVMERHGVEKNEREKRINKAIKAFPFAMVECYEPLIETLELPDDKDRHVLAAAIKTNANWIVTNNVKDFPQEYLSTFGISAKTADDFLVDTIDLNQETAIEAFHLLVSGRNNPDMDAYEVLEALKRNGLENTANYLHALI